MTENKQNRNTTRSYETKVFQKIVKQIKMYIDVEAIKFHFTINEKKKFFLITACFFSNLFGKICQMQKRVEFFFDTEQICEE